MKSANWPMVAWALPALAKGLNKTGFHDRPLFTCEYLPPYCKLTIRYANSRVLPLHNKDISSSDFYFYDLMGSTTTLFREYCCIYFSYCGSGHLLVSRSIQFSRVDFILFKFNVRTPLRQKGRTVLQVTSLV